MNKLIIFDTETTGLSEEDKIIQVGAIISELGNNEHIEKYDELCSTEIPIKIEAMSVHGIRQVDIDNKPLYRDTSFKKTIDALNSNENYLIAHNLDFDLNMLTKEGFINQYKLIDTLQCAKHLYEIGDDINGYKVPNHKLQTFRYMLLTQEDEEKEAEKYGVEIKAHDAIGDVVILKLFLLKLYFRVKEKFNISNSIEIFDKMAELTKLPVEVKIINFGKHNGKTLVEIESIDPGWIDWLHREQQKQKDSNDSKFNKDLFYTLDKLRQNRDINLANNGYDSSGIKF
ncbi:3'-5' exonuclease [Poseidonibacter ostreae]|uniref:3'-5' exonuclease n=1 Tax=Poseidonibacter ostreae TaxID=2654171 RepID=A0ABQ6VIT9_9BACT|nr:3'-5' exonuclease [Poseidonibacter ostreae]KAB7884904.1 3'-5' exonuclease [Poseidonibacter ostreae]KAB7888959.1 3'-5' exonuclease [Poseidonibacter ostreae]